MKDVIQFRFSFFFKLVILFLWKSLGSHRYLKGHLLSGPSVLLVQMKDGKINIKELTKGA